MRELSIQKDTVALNLFVRNRARVCDSDRCENRRENADTIPVEMRGVPSVDRLLLHDRNGSNAGAVTLLRQLKTSLMSGADRLGLNSRAPHMSRN
jgi:hypothetical protein